MIKNKSPGSPQGENHPLWAMAHDGEPRAGIGAGAKALSTGPTQGQEGT